MTANNTCPRCGSTNLESGDLLGGEGKMRFRPISRRFFTLRSSTVVAAFVCMDCGSVQMSIDVEDVAGMLKQEETSASEAREDFVEPQDEAAPDRVRDNDETPPSEDLSSAEPIQCLECGAKIDAGESQCPKCGWTYTAP